MIRPTGSHDGRRPAPASDVSPEFRPLHKYLAGRFADSLVLTFAQIGDLLGHPLPASALTEADWWVTQGTTLSPQSAAWVCANRSALANLRARTVRFDRVPATAL